MKHWSAFIFCSCLVGSASARNLDTNFNASATAGVSLTSVRGIALQPDGKILVAGDFTALSGHPTIGVGRLNPDGSPDTNFTANANSDVYSMIVQTNGKIVIGGSFSYLDGQPHFFLGRLNADGRLDATFTNYADLFVRCMVPQPDGKIIVVGSFSNLGGFHHVRIARISADGEVDNTFNPAASGANHTVWTAAVQTDGKILVGGTFTNLSGAMRQNIGRLNSDGSLDDSFDPGTVGSGTGMVNALAVQADGKILVSGNFTNLAGQFRNGLGRLNSDGSLDSSFDSTNKLGGTSIGLQSDGGIIIALGNNVGQVDPANGQGNTLLAPAPDDLLRAVMLQRDGKVLLGGNFTMVGGAAHSRIARLLSEGEAQESLEVNSDGTTVTWWRACLDLTFNRSHLSSPSTGWLSHRWEFLRPPTAAGNSPDFPCRQTKPCIMFVLEHGRSEACSTAPAV